MTDEVSSPDIYTLPRICWKSSALVHNQDDRVHSSPVLRCLCGQTSDLVLAPKTRTSQHSSPSDGEEARELHERAFTCRPQGEGRRRVLELDPV